MKLKTGLLVSLFLMLALVVTSEGLLELAQRKQPSVSKFALPSPKSATQGKGLPLQGNQSVASSLTNSGIPLRTFEKALAQYEAAYGKIETKLTIFKKKTSPIASFGLGNDIINLNKFYSERKITKGELKRYDLALTALNREFMKAVSAADTSEGFATMREMYENVPETLRSSLISLIPDSIDSLGCQEGKYKAIDFWLQELIEMETSASRKELVAAYLNSCPFYSSEKISYIRTRLFGELSSGEKQEVMYHVNALTDDGFLFFSETLGGSDRKLRDAANAALARFDNPANRDFQKRLRSLPNYRRPQVRASESAPSGVKISGAARGSYLAQATGEMNQIDRRECELENAYKEEGTIKQGSLSLSYDQIRDPETSGAGYLPDAVEPDAFPGPEPLRLRATVINYSDTNPNPLGLAVEIVHNTGIPARDPSHWAGTSGNTPSLPVKGSAGSGGSDGGTGSDNTLLWEDVCISIDTLPEKDKESWIPIEYSTKRPGCILKVQNKEIADNPGDTVSNLLDFKTFDTAARWIIRATDPQGDLKPVELEAPLDSDDDLLPDPYEMLVEIVTPDGKERGKLNPCTLHTLRREKEDDARADKDWDYISWLEQKKEPPRQETLGDGFSNWEEYRGFGGYRDAKSVSCGNALCRKVGRVFGIPTDNGAGGIPWVKQLFILQESYPEAVGERDFSKIFGAQTVWLDRHDYDPSVIGLTEEGIGDLVGGVNFQSFRSENPEPPILLPQAAIRYRYASAGEIDLLGDNWLGITVTPGWKEEDYSFGVNDYLTQWTDYLRVVSFPILLNRNRVDTRLEQFQKKVLRFDKLGFLENLHAHEGFHKTAGSGHSIQSLTATGTVFQYGNLKEEVDKERRNPNFNPEIFYLVQRENQDYVGAWLLSDILDPLPDHYVVEGDNDLNLPIATLMQLITHDTPDNVPMEIFAGESDVGKDEMRTYPFFILPLPAGYGEDPWEFSAEYTSASPDVEGKGGEYTEGSLTVLRPDKVETPYRTNYVLVDVKRYTATDK